MIFGFVDAILILSFISVKREFLAHRDWNFASYSRPVIGAVVSPDFGRAAHNTSAAGAALLAVRAYEGLPTAPITGQALQPAKSQNNTNNTNNTNNSNHANPA
jgi:hypothetical protein